MTLDSRTFTPQQDIELAAKYDAGATMADLCKETGQTYQSVVSALRRGNVEVRRAKATDWTGSPEQVAEVARLYSVSNLGVRPLAQMFRTRDTNISKALQDAGVEVRLGGPTHRRFTDAEAEQIAARYSAGEKVADLAEAFGSSDMTIYNTLKRLGVFRKSDIPNRTWTAERYAWLREQYQAGRTVEDIAQELGLGVASVKMRIRQSGIRQRRQRAERRISLHGYVQVVPTGDDLKVITPMATGDVLEHRLVMARALGRPLLKSETVHHINGDRADNRLTNLQLRQGNHGKGVRMQCNACGSHDVAAVSLP